MPSQVSVLKGPAGNISLLNKLPPEASSTQLYRAATGAFTASDAKLKENMQPETSVLSKLLKLNPVTYNYKKLQEIILAANKITTFTTTEITGAEKSKLFPTDLAMIVTDFLVQYFPTITDYFFTANVEKEFDEIAEGKKKWEKMLEEFYTSFHETVVSTGLIERSSISTSRELGVHPQTGEKIIARLGKYGPIAQIGEADEEKGITQICKS